ncbi:hypothetical protein GQ53DRAFT_19450 [Thozetella sp. PMI_491]|nr:hypothetical protein GQ53DRAFT_19450 [Thozetella sp. PMI_491]
MYRACERDENAGSAPIASYVDATLSRICSFFFFFFSFFFFKISPNLRLSVTTKESACLLYPPQMTISFASAVYAPQMNGTCLSLRRSASGHVLTEQ